jgi:hypothetical protein
MLAVVLPAVSLVAAYPVVFATAKEGDANIGLGPLWMCAPALAFVVAVVIRPADLNAVRVILPAWLILALTLFPIIDGDGTSVASRGVFALVASGLAALAGGGIGTLVRATARRHG